MSPHINPSGSFSASRNHLPLQQRQELGGGPLPEVLPGVALQQLVGEAVVVELFRDTAEHRKRVGLLRVALRGGEEQGEFGDAEAQGEEPEIRRESRETRTDNILSNHLPRGL